MEMESQQIPSWFYLFNEIIDFAKISQLDLFQAQKTDRSSASTVLTVLGSCSTLLDDCGELWLEECTVISRIIHRSKSQHRGALHLKHLMQLKRLLRRFEQTGLQEILSSAQKLIVCDDFSAVPSLQHLDLLSARTVSCGFFAYVVSGLSVFFTRPSKR